MLRSDVLDLAVSDSDTTSVKPEYSIISASISSPLFARESHIHILHHRLSMDSMQALHLLSFFRNIQYHASNPACGCANLAIAP